LENAKAADDSSCAGLGRWEIAYSDLTLGPRIGGGGGGVVYLGKFSGQPVAVKHIYATLNGEMDELANEAASLANEAASLATLSNSPNVVQFFGVSRQCEDIYVVMEHCKSSLQAVIEADTWPTAQQS
jgi:serine/threonine protein kinase